MALKYTELRGAEILPHLEDIARLRIEVFAEWPYLYDGSLDYEKKYLDTYVKSKNSLVVLMSENGRAVGASTAIWLPEAEDEFQKPFRDKKIDVKSVFYFGESVVLRSHRGKGAGSVFMEARERFARNLPGVNMVAFCVVVRPNDHPAKPKDYRSLNEFWEKTGFKPAPNMIASFKWKDHGEKTESEKRLQFWTKKLI